MKKKYLVVFTIIGLCSLAMFGCGKKKGFDDSSKIGVVVREEGSGTRGAFNELFGIEEKGKDGKKVDKTVANAVTTNSTAVMLTTVSGDLYSIGYASLGSMNNTVKGLKVDGVEATAKNIMDNKYKIARPFQIVTKDNLKPLAKDFIKFILSDEGQEVVKKDGYIPIKTSGKFDGEKISGKIVVGGSSSVTPVMEKLKEAYEKLNPNGNIEVQQSDSSTGIENAINGVCDIGMASRNLHDSENNKGVKATTIAMDGIVVIANTENTIDNVTKDQVKDIFTGKITKWNELK